MMVFWFLGMVLDSEGMLIPQRNLSDYLIEEKRKLRNLIAELEEEKKKKDE